MSEMGQSLESAVSTIQSGGVLIYPTEGVFGLGCDYRNQAAVQKLLKLKNRSANQGLILIASHIQHILPLIQPGDRTDLARALKSWPGHNTWVFPNTERVPSWVTGEFKTVAVRVSKHPAVKSLCDQLGHAVVSTSANISGQPTAEICQDFYNIWGDQVNYYWDLPLGNANNPSPIRLASDGRLIR